MRVVRFIALLGTSLGAAGCATLYVWTFSGSWDTDQADRASGVLSVALFVFLLPAIFRSKRLRLWKMSTSLPQPSPLMAVVPHILLYVVINVLVGMVVIKCGGIHARNGRYFQNPWWGHIRDTEWEIPFATYKRLYGFDIRTRTAFLFLFYFASFAIFSLPESDPSDED